MKKSVTLARVKLRVYSRNFPKEIVQSSIFPRNLISRSRCRQVDVKERKEKESSIRTNQRKANNRSGSARERSF